VYNLFVAGSRLAADAGRSGGMKRRFTSLSPVFATLALTAAIFLLPASGDGRQAQAAPGGVQLSAANSGQGIVLSPGN